MSKKANPTLIGAFVVGAIALAIAALAIFGAGEFFKVRFPVVTYFPGSVQGLHAGSPVLFRGVDVGEVAEIRLIIDREALEAEIPVVLAIDPHRFSDAGKGTNERRTLDAETCARLIDAGLRAKLVPQSFVTGQLAVELSFRPGTPVHLVNPGGEFPEIPTVPSDIEQAGQTFREVIEAIKKLPVEALLQQLTHSIESINGILDSPQVSQTITSLNEALAAVRDASHSIEAQTGPLAQRVGDAADAAADALGQAQDTFASLDTTVASDSPLQIQLATVLEEISDTSRSLRVLADYLERHPEALLRGKPGGRK